MFCFFSHKAFSRSLKKLWLNHWCHMDYFNNVLTTFLGLWTFQLHCCLCRVRKLWDFIKKSWFVFRRWTNVLQFGTLGWVTNDGIFIFGWTLPLKYFFPVISVTEELGLYSMQMVNMLISIGNHTLLSAQVVGVVASETIKMLLDWVVASDWWFMFG